MDAEIKKASLSYASFTSSYVNPSFNVEYTAASFDVAYIAATYEVNYINMTPTTIEAGLYILRQSLSDFGYVLDQLAVSLGKTFSDSANFSLTVTYDFAKSIGETAQTSDVLTKATGSSLQDQPIISENIDSIYFSKITFDTANFSSATSVSTTKPLSDTAAFVDDQTTNFGKGLEDSPVTGDLLALEYDKFLANSGAGTDTQALSIGKVADDSANFTLETTLDTTKLLSDSIHVTDDVDGEASIEDDQNMLFTKSRTEVIWLTDSLDRTVAYSRAFSDSGVASDNVINFQTSKGLDDTVSSDDSTQTAFGKALSDNGLATDNLLRSVDYIRAFAEQGDYNDSATLLAGKVSSDNFSATDLFARTVSFSRNFSDSASLGDFTAIDIVFTREFSDSAIWQDGVSLGVSTVLTDNGYVLENKVKSFGKGNSDSASVTDSGSLYGQDYVDNLFYFAEDYVGYNATF